MHWSVIYWISSWGNILASLKWWRKPLCGAARSGWEGVLQSSLSWLYSALPASVFELQKKFLLWERKGSDETSQPFHGQQREIGTFMARFASYKNVWIKPFICLSLSIDSEIRLWLTLNTSSACISLRSSQVRWIQYTLFSLSCGL